MIPHHSVQNGGDGCGETNKWENEHCTTGHTRHIYEGGFANCAATVKMAARAVLMMLALQNKWFTGT